MQLAVPAQTENWIFVSKSGAYRRAAIGKQFRRCIFNSSQIVNFRRTNWNRSINYGTEPFEWLIAFVALHPSVLHICINKLFSSDVALVHTKPFCRKSKRQRYEWSPRPKKRINDRSQLGIRKAITQANIRIREREIKNREQIRKWICIQSSTLN